MLRHTVQLISIAGVSVFVGIHSSSHPYSLRSELHLVSLTEENAFNANSVDRVL